MAVINAKAGWAVALCMAAMVVASVPLAEASITCNQVTTAVMPCLGYLENGGNPTRNCCSGVANLNNAARSTPDRQQACKCLQQAAAAFPNVKETFAGDLPGKCNVKIPYKISRSTNCASVK